MLYVSNLSIFGDVDEKRIHTFRELVRFLGRFHPTNTPMQDSLPEGVAAKRKAQATQKSELSGLPSLVLEPRLGGKISKPSISGLQLCDTL